MREINIRQLLPEDMAKMSALIQSRDDLDGPSKEKRVSLLEWVAFKNPFGNGELTYFVAEDQGRIVAHLGRMPSNFLVNGKVERGYFVHDLYVDPQYRKQGKGLFLSMSLYKAVEANSPSFCCLVWTSDLNLQMQKQRGYYEMHAGRYVKLLNPYSKLERILRPKTLAKTTSFILQGLSRVVECIVFLCFRPRPVITKLNLFDSRFDAMAVNSRIYKLGVMPLKESKYLNWKFIHRPYSKAVVLSAEKGDDVAGFAVLDTVSDGNYLTGIILDIMADPEDKATVSALLWEAIKHFRKHKVDAIECCLSNKQLGNIFQKFLFLKIFVKKQPVMLANLDKVSYRDLLTDITKWHLTYAASDFRMLRG